MYRGICYIGLLDCRHALVSSKFPVEGGSEFYALNTHLSAFAQGTNILERQVEDVKEHLDGLEMSGKSWVAAGDFNVLPPGGYERLIDYAKFYYSPETELVHLCENFFMIPRLEDLTCEDCAQWYTHFCNDPMCESAR